MTSETANPGATATFEVLDRTTCLALVATATVGRLAVAVAGGPPLVVPVNFVLDGDTVVFRSDPGSKLRLLAGRAVSFQVDHVPPGGGEGWSVLVQGRAGEVPARDVAHLRLVPWAPGDKDHWVRLRATVVTGRRLRRPGGPAVDVRGYL